MAAQTALVVNANCGLARNPVSRLRVVVHGLSAARAVACLVAALLAHLVVVVAAAVVHQLMSGVVDGICGRMDDETYLSLRPAILLAGTRAAVVAEVACHQAVNQVQVVAALAVATVGSPEILALAVVPVA